MAYTSVHLPVGYEVAIQTDPAVPNVYTDLGVTNAAGSLAFTYDAIKVTGSQAEKVQNFYKNMALEATFSLFQLELSNINRLMSGATSYASVAGTPVTGASQTAASGAWNYNTFIPFANQNGDGSIISVTSVTGGTDGVLVEDTDFFVTKVGTQYGIMIIDSTTVTTESQAMVIVYDYTPSAKRTLSAGSASVDVTSRAMRIRKQLDSGKYWTMYIYAAVNTSGLTFSLPRYDEDEPASLEVTMTGQLDTTRSDLDQLFKIEDEFGITDI